MSEKGQIAVQTENIFPIIKKFLYSDQEIFLRELVSNAIDATSKLQTLSSKGLVKGDLGDLTIDILIDEKKKTLTIRDQGIGLSADEARKYLNQVALSSAQDFIEKYSGEANIIGHFGLGFYSAFMVADKVDVLSKSYNEDESPILWTCDGSPEYTLKEVKKKSRGTDIILHINEDGKEYLEKNKIEDLLKKYCRFLPFPIRFGTKTEYDWEGEGEDRKEKKTEVDNIINITHPIWKKSPTDLTDEDYKKFYSDLYLFSAPPLFWIHLNIDYPFNLTGILYFPKMTTGMDWQKNKIQLYSNQVYVTDEVKDIVPDFLMMLHGVIDSPDIPLNVSRSYLQSDRQVKKITSYISKKVAEKLEELFKNDRPGFESKWNDIGPFVKYGMLTDEKFYEKAVGFALFKSQDGAYHTLNEYRDKIKVNQTNKNGEVIYLYTHAPAQYHAQISAAGDRGYDVLVLDQPIDNHFAQHLESKIEKTHFARIDSETLDKLIEKEEKIESVLSADELDKVKKIFEPYVQGSMNKVEVQSLSPSEAPVHIIKPEFMRRMKEMQMMQGLGADMFPDSYQVIVNGNHPIIAEKLMHATAEQQVDISKHLYRLALLNQNMLSGADLTDFVKKSLQMI
ncbi:MAG: molecular chaperone HtpG [Saprospiraceae bacterium]|jgi:molecular chaperone HtpG|nr:molecular chaperone HtpG [Saprospiraceae bacterium]MBK6815154.1 molecular chaperone HtpG [Saprospiraceae bacterium]MBK7372192.1 molecular chaperone HtpG [Saprospiraceae bacterium]MBL0113166.1 molecular chaperone HtpG [Saprospiraceae bacterium]MBP7921129.1 molecular chaperone HtpG [Saprospiraceae bacterium]